MIKDVIILANSRKLSGRCVAGKTTDGDWIRIVKNIHDPIMLHEARRYNLLQVLNIKGLVNRPSREFVYHTENYSYTEATSVGYYDPELLDNLLDNPTTIFGHGRCLSEVQVNRLQSSLLFVKVTNFVIYITNDTKKKLRSKFTYNNIFYTDISVTDSVVEQSFANKQYPYREMYDEAYITISLGELYYEYAYKLVSGIIIP